MKKGSRNNIIKFPVRYIFHLKPKHVVASLSILITAIWGVLQIYDWVKKNAELDIVMQTGVSLTYLKKNSEQYSNLYPLFEGCIDSKKDYRFSENCVTKLMITNHYDNQIVIDKIVLEAREIEVDYSPILIFSIADCTDEGLSIYITNTGWGNAQNLKIAIKGINQNLEDYFRKEALEFALPLIEPATYIEVPFLNNSDLLGQCPDGTSFNIAFEVECECEGTLEIDGEVSFFVQDGKLDYLGGGAGPVFVYGIKIDTDNQEFLWEENILELIDSRETLVFPICFFPNKSCSLLLNISFEIVNDGKREMISTGLERMHFSVSSIEGWNDVINYPIEEVLCLEDHEAADFFESEGNMVISYPFSPAIKAE